MARLGVQGKALRSHSADGSIAIVGGPFDDSNSGAAWVFVCSGAVWTQQGAKLAGAGVVGKARQGTSVALSADGSTAILGGVEDNSYTGAAWVFTRSNGTWTQQGGKLVGTGATPADSTFFGSSVALSADGNTALIGGSGDNNDNGAMWVFTRGGGFGMSEMQVWQSCSKRMIHRKRLRN